MLCQVGDAFEWTVGCGPDQPSRQKHAGGRYDLAIHEVDIKHRSLTCLPTDDYLDIVIANATKNTEPYVLIYTSSQQLRVQEQTEQDHPYEMDEPYPSALHTDLKRDLEHHKKRAHSNAARRQPSSSNADSGQSNLPLFETYQFLSPGKVIHLASSTEDIMLMLCTQDYSWV